MPNMKFDPHQLNLRGLVFVASVKTATASVMRQCGDFFRPHLRDQTLRGSFVALFRNLLRNKDY